MKREKTWEDEIEATDPELIAELEENILEEKALLTSLSGDGENLFQ